MRVFASAVAIVAICALGGPADSRAGFSGGADLVSADYERLEQGDDTTTFAAISGNGRYVAIQTRARNFFADDDPDPPGAYRAGGLFRFDLNTRGLEKIADGDLFDEQNRFLRRGASNPSISRDGRFVAFATAEPLVATDLNDNVDVYVRDMQLALGAPGAFELISARAGGDVPATYGPPPFPFPGSNAGSDVSRGVSISADGRFVAFRTEAPSDLPAAAGATVPSGQLLVRDRQTDETVLVTRADPGGDPAGGALGGAISADGSTVAWTGTNAPAQTRMLGGENPDPSFPYYLWRRLADGPGAPTRRVTGLADPDDPACPPGATSSFDQISTGPCYGPLTDQEANRASISAQLPVMSADGRTVAYLTGAGPRPIAATGPGLDLFVTSMEPGASRKQATVELTRDPTSSNPAAGPPIDSIAMAADGTHLAVATVRTAFSLPALQLTDEPRSVPGARELYLVDLESRTLERVTRSFGGGDIDGDVANGVTLSEDGGRLAFTSIAGNLFFGDANQRADAFVATRLPDAEGPPPVPEDQGPSGEIDDENEARIRARARSARRGRVTIAVDVPAAGGVKAVAEGKVGHPRKRRALASKSARALGPQTVELRLRPVRRYRVELRERSKITARTQVTYVAASGGRRLSTSIKTVFRERP